MLVCLLLLAPVPAAAQAVNGSAEWGYGRSAFATADQQSVNDSLTQAYTLGYQSALWDPRFLTYAGELSFRRNALGFGTQNGSSNQTGFTASASLFPARPFPLSVQASRSGGGETANYPSSNPIRGGFTLSPGEVTALTTRQSALGVNWRLNAARLPRVELNYQKGASAVAVGSVEALQNQTSFHALVGREGPKLRTALRYDRNGFENELSQAFTQRYDELGYELVATVSPRTSASVRAGRRSTFSLFDVPTRFTAIGDAAYRPPSTGEMELYYGLATLTHRPVSRVSTDLSVGYDRERSDAGRTNALVGVAATRLNVLSGLTLNGNASYGQRGQLLSVEETTALTRSVGAGADYGIAFRFLQLGAGYDVGQGRNTSELRDGRTRSWRRRANASSGLLWLMTLSVGHEQGQSRDDLLEFGNQWQERTRATARSRPAGRFSLEASWEQATIEQGRDLRLSRSRYTQSSGTAAMDLSRESRMSVSAGHFLNRSFGGDDTTQFLGVSLDSALARGLRLTMTARREHTISERSRLDQWGLYTVGQIEYRVRLFTFSFEHRYTDLALTTAAQIDPLALAGNQILFRVGRRFGFGR